METFSTSYPGAEGGPSIGTMHICPLCRKPFLDGRIHPLDDWRSHLGAMTECATELSYTRHTGYCRRARTRPRARVRSCRACSLAKAKCSFHSQCLRCVRKGIECSYDAGPVPPRDPVAVRDVLAHDAAAIPADLFADNNFTSKDPFPESATFDQSAIDWSTIDDIFLQSPDNKLSDFAAPTAKLMLNSSSFLDTNSSSQQSVERLFTNVDEDTLSITQSRVVKHDQLVPHIAPQAPAREQDTHLLARLPASRPNSRFASSILMQMLRSFPEMVLRRENFPFFVHPISCRDTSDSVLPEPLLNCIGIAQVFASHNPQSKSFLWRAIESEQRCFVQKVCTLSVSVI